MEPLGSHLEVFLPLFGSPWGLIFKLFRCCPRTLRLLPLCPSNAGSASARASAYNPPTTACGATSVFETPSVLRESLPSYSAKPGAFYAPRALRWTTPRPKIKPMFHRCSMLFQDDLGIENGGQNGVKILLKSSLSAFPDALGARLPLEAMLASILDRFLHPPNH